MKPIKKACTFLYSIYSIVAFVILMLIVFPFVLFFSSIKTNRNIRRIYNVCRVWARVWYTFIFIRHKKIYASKSNSGKQYIFVANHTSYLDIPQLLLAIPQPIRVLARHDLARIPVFGIIYKAAAVLVNRENSESRAKSLLSMYACLKENFSLFIFPEGTFNETGKPLKSFQDGAFRLSMNTGIPIKPIIFPDTSKRLKGDAVFGFNPGISRSIYLEEINPKSFADARLLKEKVYADMKQALEFYNCSN